MRKLQPILDMALEGRRLDADDALALLASDDLPTLGEAAHAVRLKKTRPDAVTYVVDRNINYTNVCDSRCRFCAFYRAADHPEAYRLSYEAVGEKVAEMIALGGRQILLQGGLHPDLSLEWHEGLLCYLKSNHGIHNHAYSAPEIAYLARREGLSVETALKRLRDAGLDTMPGGGAEVLSDRLRRRVSPGKCSADEWIAVHRAAHGLGVRTSATMMFGHGDTPADRVEHFERLRRLQDETGGFTAFIVWTFQAGNTALSRGQEGSEATPRGAHEYLKTLAVARLYLDNFANFQASWVTQGEAVGQIALRFGCNDFGSVMIEENVVRAAGCEHRLSEPRIRALIAEAGYEPLRRDYLYRLQER